MTSYSDFTNHLNNLPDLERFIRLRFDAIMSEARAATADSSDWEKFTHARKLLENEISVAFSHGYERGWNDADQTFNPEDDDEFWEE